MKFNPFHKEHRISLSVKHKVLLFFFATISLLVLLLIVEYARNAYFYETAEEVGTVSGPANAVAFHIEPAGPEAAIFKPADNFGKGKFISFWVYPPNEDLLINTIKVRKHGASDSEIPFAWLRLNTIRSYVRVPFDNDLATFNVFPPSAPEEGTYQYYKNEQEDQKLVVKDGLANFPVTLTYDISVQIFGEFDENISARGAEEGIYFCVEEVSGVLMSTGQAASARLPGPLCFNKMGITR